MEAQATNGVLEEFRLEFLECWGRLPSKLLFFVLVCVWVLLFQFLGSAAEGYGHTASLFGYVSNAYREGSTSFLETEQGYAVFMPLVVLGLAWFKRRELLASELRPWGPGLLIFVAGILLHLLGFRVQQQRISVVGFFVGIYGMMGMLWGRQWLRCSLFPFFLFGFCVPIGTLAGPVTLQMRLLVSQLVGFVSHYILAIDVGVQGNIIFDPSGRYVYEIAAACSGIRSLTATLALAIIVAFVSFRKPWKRLVLIASAFPLAVLGNLIRMLAIIVAAEIWGPQCGAYVHDGGPGGVLSLLPYIPAFVGLLGLEHYLRSGEVKTDMAPLKPLVLKGT